LRGGRYSLDWCGVVWCGVTGVVHRGGAARVCGTVLREGQLSSGHSPEFDFGAFPLTILDRICTMKIEHENRTFVTFKSASPGLESQETRAERDGLVYGYDTAFGELLVFTS
jgi:hypothetical protein